MKREINKIDATNKALGRLSTDAAVLLMGKHKVEYAPNTDIGDFVEIINCDKIKFTGRKLEQQKHYRHSGYPGGLKEFKLSDEFEKNPELLVRNTVMHMLPKNKLRKERIKRLKFV
ncbi:50S ribosomal protein L13 [Patescibacteria group bacterium]|nr:50S ribosomal protein L13 [Patescibacteria group bacterium]